MRCLALANVLRARGARVRFVTRQISAHLRALAADRGHALTILPEACEPGALDDLAHSHWLGMSQRADADLTRAELAGVHVDWLVVDHYALDARWESAVRPGAASILAIDDLADRDHDCDALLDQNLHEDLPGRYAGKVPPRCRLLLGPTYALLREEFARLRVSLRTRDGVVRRILVLMGGIDQHNLTGLAVDAISRLPGRIAVDVVVGASHAARESIAALCRRHGYALHVQPPNVGELMAAADLAIGACGSTAWERCCLGLPTICLTEAENQASICAALQTAGAVVNLGNAHGVNAGDLAVALGSLLGEPRSLMAMSERAAGLADGNGAERVASALLN